MYDIGHISRMHFFTKLSLRLTGLLEGTEELPYEAYLMVEIPSVFLKCSRGGIPRRRDCSSRARHLLDIRSGCLRVRVRAALIG